MQGVAGTHTIPPYPPEAVQANEQGSVLMLVLLGTDGVPRQAHVQTSSGSKYLDDASVSWILKNWRWQPFKDTCSVVQTQVLTKFNLETRVNGKPVTFPKAGSRNVQIRAKASDYPAGALQKREQGIAKFEVLVATSGEIVFHRLISGTGFLDLDVASADLVLALRMRPAEVNGVPAQSAVLVEIVWDANTKD